MSVCESIIRQVDYASLSHEREQQLRQQRAYNINTNNQKNHEVNNIDSNDNDSDMKSINQLNNKTFLYSCINMIPSCFDDVDEILCIVLHSLRGIIDDRKSRGQDILTENAADMCLVLLRLTTMRKFSTQQNPIISVNACSNTGKKSII
jgi:hypothetical protein